MMDPNQIRRSISATKHRYLKVVSVDHSTFENIEELDSLSGVVLIGSFVGVMYWQSFLFYRVEVVVE